MQPPGLLHEPSVLPVTDGRARRPVDGLLHRPTETRSVRYGRGRAAPFSSDPRGHFSAWCRAAAPISWRPDGVKNGRQDPVTVLTGYLGAGKTTLLNRILSEPHGQRYAVIVNEFGEIGIDNDLVVGADEEVFEMNNGCICCTVRGDLVRIIDGLMRRKGRVRRDYRGDYRSGRSAPVAQTFFMDENVGRKARLDAVVTVADAKWLGERLSDAPEAKNQIAFADVILLNKTDLVQADELGEVEARIRGINPYARLHRTERCRIRIAGSAGTQRLRSRSHPRDRAGIPGRWRPALS